MIESSSYTGSDVTGYIQVTATPYTKGESILESGMFPEREDRNTEVLGGSSTMIGMSAHNDPYLRDDRGTAIYSESGYPLLLE